MNQIKLVVSTGLLQHDLLFGQMNHENRLLWSDFKGYQCPAPRPRP